MMGWDVVPSGLKVRFSRDIPSFIEKHIPSALQEIKHAWNMPHLSFSHYVMHPGGIKVLDAYCTALGISRNDLRYSERVLSHYGNMSSCSVLFVLAELMKELAYQPKSGHAIMMALGPGFSAESLLLELHS